MSATQIISPNEPDADYVLGRPRLGTVWVVFVLSRLYLLLLFMPQFSDLQVYFDYAVRGVDLQQTPYRDFAIEYPPVAYWLMAVPRLLSEEPITEEVYADRSQLVRHYSDYAAAFRWIMAAVDLAGFLLFLAVIRRRQSCQLVPAAWGFVIATAALGHFLYDRLDIALSLLFMTWMYARVRSSSSHTGKGWNAFSYFVLGVSVSFKLIGVVAIPFVLLSDWRQARADRNAFRATAPLIVCGIAGAVLPFVLHYSSAGLSPLEFLTFHGERGIQIESSYASLLLLWSVFGHGVSVQMSHGSADLVSWISPKIATGSTFCVLGSLMIPAVWSLTRRSKGDQSAGTKAALLAVLLTLLFSKVFSAQYLIFAVPLVLLLSSELLSRRAHTSVAAISVIISLLTTIVVPYYWFNTHPFSGVENPLGLVPDLHSFPCSLLVLRNVLFALLVGWLGFSLVRTSRTAVSGS
ncbi:MAG: hypothetical protein O3B13_08405 [Planctomycetota bacterium]|nr:hypothetical protein [Planctomycetota bacterium]